MMDWTDRHCRAFHRILSRHALLYTEMVTSAALVRGDARHLLAFGETEYPVALQLGGSDPAELAKAARMGAQEGYDEINLNVGCPSDRVQSGSFGAVLMERPELVGACCAEMIAAQDRPVTVKCRIGVDDQDPQQALPALIEAVAEAGVTRITVHARKAWLQGLSPKENRDIPPLDYPLVHGMAARYPALHMSINGGITDLDGALAHLEAGMDGVMVGRAAYHDPMSILAEADSRIFGDSSRAPLSPHDAARGMRPYIAAHVAGGGKLAQVTRHMLGLFTGRPGARAWRRILSENSHKANAGLDVFDMALAAVPEQARQAAE